MITENIKALVEYRLDQADESLAAAQILLEKMMLRTAVNRSYYAMFYAVLSLLAVDKKETSKHSGAVSLFDKEFVKRGVFAKDFSRWLHEAFDLRQITDYSAESSVSLEDAQLSFAHANAFVEEVKSVLKRNYHLNLR